jgi:hypothetical protein
LYDLCPTPNKKKNSLKIGTILLCGILHLVLNLSNRFTTVSILPDQSFSHPLSLQRMITLPCTHKIRNSNCFNFEFFVTPFRSLLFPLPNYTHLHTCRREKRCCTFSCARYTFITQFPSWKHLHYLWHHQILEAF